jgi:hypothetical protein
VAPHPQGRHPTNISSRSPRASAYVAQYQLTTFSTAHTQTFMSSETVYENAIAWSRSWLLSCLENHTSCSKKARHANIFCTDNWRFITDLRGDGLVGSRLLVFPIAPPPEVEALVVKLVQSTNFSQDTQYAALSHRWGPPEIPVPCTREANLDAHIETGPRYDDLPKTFRDAIHIARAIG